MSNNGTIMGLLNGLDDYHHSSHRRPLALVDPVQMDGFQRCITFISPSRATWFYFLPTAHKSHFSKGHWVGGAGAGANVNSNRRSRRSASSGLNLARVHVNAGRIMNELWSQLEAGHLRGQQRWGGILLPAGRALMLVEQAALCCLPQRSDVSGLQTLTPLGPLGKVPRWKGWSLTLASPAKLRLQVSGTEH